MADERQTASGSDLGKDPVFLVMVSGQIESAEVSSVTVQDYYHIKNNIIIICDYYISLPGSVCILWSLQFPEYDELYCNYSFVYGQDWAIVSVSIIIMQYVCLCTALAVASYMYNDLISHIVGLLARIQSELSFKGILPGDEAN